MMSDARLKQAQVLYERAVFDGDEDAVPAGERVLDGVEADLALARGRLLHARFLEERAEDPRELKLFERAATLYARLGDGRGEGEALFWVGIVHQVVRDDTERALPFFERSLALAGAAGDRLTASYALRHLGFADGLAGRPDAARERLEESTRLRREIGFGPGVAANLIVLARLAVERADREEAEALLTEATELAERTGAKGVLRWVAATREELGVG
ncbi:tetratricopeptide repeat protein [Streptomyces griseosporeus]|uniref:tetratricopeptide repeat protein n=2 Tax=Streptomyces griseosporeus TaxID=1910 RepID=UPI0036FBF383